uniref:Phospholipase B-like n=1 Tax=Bursaphelenchus xylophilus TaxID=6326 RepID=A0A1I7SUI5_BURXY
MWPRTVAFLFVLLTVGLEAKSYRHFERLFDSSEEEIHGKVHQKLDTTSFQYHVKTLCHNDKNNSVYLIEGSDCANKIAVGKYSNQVNSTGWGILEVETFPEFTDEVQAYAAGVVEGSLTKLQIYYHFRNTIEGNCNGANRDYCKRLYRYLRSNLDWVQSQVLNPALKDDPYWRQVNLTYTQVTGIYHGYHNNKDLDPAVEFEITPILMLQIAGDLFDLAHLLKKPKQVSDDPDPGHCTGFVKLTKGNKDLMISHVSMSGYNTMNRLMKLYKFAYDKTVVPGHTYSFSSYAGALVSQDDYTLISSGLATIETTISIFNESLYTSNYMNPKGQLLCWVRSTIANQLATSGKEWVKLFGKYNSGTYNNQWTILDYNKFSPGKELPNNDVLWILEQTPGYTESRDVTWFLRKFGYWPSYNIPYQTKVSEISGFDEKGSQLDWWRWGYSPRAKILERDHDKVVDIPTLFKLMRYNNYTQDEFSKCACNPPYTAEAAISSRGDLNPANGTYVIEGMGHRNHGSLDYKGTNYELFKKLQIHTVGGPTYDPLPPFSWNTTDIVAPHYGQPTLWKFQPFITEWETKVSAELHKTNKKFDKYFDDMSDESLETIF